MNSLKRFQGTFAIAIAALSHPLSSYAQESTAEANKPAYYVAEFQVTDVDGIKPYSAQVEATFKNTPVDLSCEVKCQM